LRNPGMPTTSAFAAARSRVPAKGAMPGGEVSPFPAGGYSIRKRALDLLFTMCDRSNAGEIVGELLEYLTVADFNIREDLVPPP